MPSAGTAISLNGSSQYAAAKNPLNITSAIVTISFWVNYTINGNFARFIDIGDNTNNIQVIYDQGSNQLVTKHTQYETALTSTQWGTFTGSAWTHLVVVFDSIHSVATLYLNSVKQTAASGPIAGAVTGTTQIFFGVRNDLNAVTFMSGALENFSMWSRALSQQEVTYLYRVEPYAGLTPPWPLVVGAAAPTDTLFGQAWM